MKNRFFKLNFGSTMGAAIKQKIALKLATATALALALGGCMIAPQPGYRAASNGYIYYFTAGCFSYELGVNATLVCKGADGRATGEVLTPATQDELEKYKTLQEARANAAAANARASEARLYNDIYYDRHYYYPRAWVVHRYYAPPRVVPAPPPPPPPRIVPASAAPRPSAPPRAVAPASAGNGKGAPSAGAKAGAPRSGGAGAPRSNAPRPMTPPQR